jgi:transcriptional regulator GlxA family with amidase domain
VGGGSEEGLRTAILEEDLAVWIARNARRVRRIGSICTGAFVLAAAGLLDGRRAATHWASCEHLQRMRPAIDVDADAIFVKDPPIYTSAGVTAGIDLALSLVEEDLGSECAAIIAREMVLFLRRSGGQSQYSELLSIQAVTGATFSELIAWIAEHPASDLGVAALARRAGMSDRTFMRAFPRETGSTPAAFVRKTRVECARRLLETTNWPVKRIAERSGFGSEDSLERAFRSLLRQTPDQFRLRFTPSPARPRGRTGRRRGRGPGSGRRA